MPDNAAPRTAGLLERLRHSIDGIAKEPMGEAHSRIDLEYIRDALVDAADALARLTERNRALEEALMEFRDVLVDLPEDALGVGRAVEAHWITGDAEEVRWPIRDEMIDKITRALTDPEAPRSVEVCPNNPKGGPHDLNNLGVCWYCLNTADRGGRHAG